MDLPLRTQNKRIEVSEGVTFLLRDVADTVMMSLMESGSHLAKMLTPEEGVDDETSQERQRVAVYYAKSAELHRSFAEAYVGVELATGDALTIGGTPFDAKDPSHFFSLPLLWRINLVGGILGSVTEGTTTLGNSNASSTSSAVETSKKSSSPRVRSVSSSPSRSSKTGTSRRSSSAPVAGKK